MATFEDIKAGARLRGLDAAGVVEIVQVALQARMFTGRMTEDPATGSATSAMVALLVEMLGAAELKLRVGQGTDMGRPSLMLARARQENGGVMAFVGGRCVEVMEGTITSGS
jgi:trans-2,3-dihydro-3-hydroxyanthranilate isomerase